MERYVRRVWEILAGRAGIGRRRRPSTADAARTGGYLPREPDRLPAYIADRHDLNRQQEPSHEEVHPPMRATTLWIGLLIVDVRGVPDAGELLKLRKAPTDARVVGDLIDPDCVAEAVLPIPRGSR